MSGKDEAAEEILIIRRRGGGEEEGHHGGVWKIAYADFMTAMMAFFLVMWLINASNTETKASIASYFNPMRLTDTVSRKNGLRKIDAKSTVEDSSALGESDESTEKADGGREDSKFQEKHTQKAGNKSDTEQPREKSETTEDAS
ncbi:MAG: flagellar motor protein MotB, partial [Hyphomicrobiaceae bacterium]